MISWSLGQKIQRRYFKANSSFAIPLDCFRIGTGLLSLLYFARAFYEAPYFLGKNSLINHQIVEEIFWYTWQPLFSSSMSTATVQIILAFGMLFSLLLIIGFYSRFISFILYLIVVCLYRYQFLVMFVDDVVMHLLLFWCFLLPTGKTLNLLPWLKDRKIMNQWMETKTESFVQNLFFYNIALIYFIAGVSKTSSRLWIDGIAIFAVLKLPMGWFSNYTFEAHETWLRIANYAALTIEPMFILLLFLKSWSRPKLLLGLAFAFFHIFIILTLDVPFANLGCLFLVPLIFREELMDVIKKFRIPRTSTTATATIYNEWPAKIIAVITVVLLTGAMTCALTQNQWRSAKRVTGKDTLAEVKSSTADTGGKIQTFFYSGLWLMGLAQGYRLLDWIDERNFHQVVKVIEDPSTTKKEYNRSKLVPIGMRGSLILTYISDVTWMYVDPDHIDTLRQDIKQRLIKRHCGRIKKKTDVEVWQALTKIDSFQVKYNQPEILMKFTCKEFVPLET